MSGLGKENTLESDARALHVEQDVIINPGPAARQPARSLEQKNHFILSAQY
jgi:hypothetical protein